MKIAALILGAFAVTSQALAPLNRGQKVVPSQYIVVLNEKVDASAHLAALKAFGETDPSNEILDEYSFGNFKGYAIRCNEEVLQYIREAESVVKFVEEDQYVSVYDAQSNPPSWGLDRVDQRALPLDRRYAYPSSAGQGVDMYTIDTGIYIQHSDFGGRAVWGYNAATGSSDDDRNGHGTHCSGTMAGSAYGIAKKANLIAVKVLGDNGSGTNSWVISGVNWVANRHTAGKKSVANMSLGGGASSALDQAVDAAVAKGVHVAVAAGNDNANACNYSPARSTRAVTVGATESTDRKSSFSNHGTCVDIHAPGTSITSAWIGGPSSTRTISGTSMASPHVAGVMALYLSEGKVPSEANLVAASTKNVITGLPSGTVNNLLYTSDSIATEEIKEPKIFF